MTFFEVRPVHAETAERALVAAGIVYASFPGWDKHSYEPIVSIGVEDAEQERAAEALKAVRA
jgi:hypothetical protein